MIWPRLMMPAVAPIVRVLARMTRGTTLGVRVVVTDDRGWVLLVEHSYVPGWQFPGGGVERGEIAEAAVARELVEEAGVRPIARPRLISIHSQHRHYPGDQILLYRVDAWEPCPATSRGEIHRIDWFDPGSPPPGTTRATLARLDEVFKALLSDPEW